jgi:trimeric autotransporter adhesin
VSQTALQPVSSLLQRRLLRLFCAKPDTASSTSAVFTGASGSGSSSSKQKSKGKGKRARALEASWAEPDASKLRFVPLRLLESWGTATTAITSSSGDGGSNSSAAREDSRGGCCAREAVGHLLACAWSLHASIVCSTDSSSSSSSSSDSTTAGATNAEAVRLARAVLHRPLTTAVDSNTSSSTPTLSSSVSSSSSTTKQLPVLLRTASVPLRAALSLVRFVRTGLPMDEQLATTDDAQSSISSSGTARISDDYGDSDAPALPQCDPCAVSGRHVAGVAAMVGEALLSCLLSDNCSSTGAATTTAATGDDDGVTAVPYSWGSGLSEQHSLLLEAACDVLRAVAVAAKQLQQNPASHTATTAAAGASHGALKAAAAGRQELFTAAHSLQADGLGLARGMSDGEAVPAVLTIAGALQFLALHLQSGEPPAEQSLGRWLGVCQALSLLQQHFAECSLTSSIVHISSSTSTNSSAISSVQTAATVLLQLYKASLLPVPDDDSAESDRYTSVATSPVGVSLTMSQELSAQLTGQRQQQQQQRITLSSSSVRAAVVAEAQSAEALHLSARVALLLTLKVVLPQASQSTPAAAAAIADSSNSLRVLMLSALDCSASATTVSSAGTCAAVLCERFTKDLVDGLEDGLPPKEVAAHLDVIEVSSKSFYYSLLLALHK